MTATKRELLRDMSAAQAECNSALQEIDHVVHKGVYGKGRRRRRSAPVRREAAPLPRDPLEEARMCGVMDAYLDSVG